MKKIVGNKIGDWFIFKNQLQTSEISKRKWKCESKY